MKPFPIYRTFLNLALVLTILSCMTAPVLADQDTAQSNALSGFQSIVGSWKLVDDQNGDIFFGTYNGGFFKGTVNFTSPDNFTSLTHGAWERTGARSFADTDSGFIYDANGLAIQIITFRAEIELSLDGDTGLFDFEFEITDLDGNFFFAGSSTATGTRIKVEPLSVN